MLYISGEDANDLFKTLNEASVDEVLESMSFLWDTANEFVFEYNSDWNHAWYLCGLAHEKNSSNALAAISFLTAFPIYPHDADAFVAYTNCENNLDAQIAAFKSFGSQITDWRVLLNVSNALIDSGNYEAAVVLLNKIDARERDNPSAVAALQSCEALLSRR